MNTKLLKADWPKHVILLLAGFITFYPFIFMVQTSFKSSFQFQHEFWLPTFPLQPLNYKDAFNQIWPYLVNSFVVSGVTVILVLGLASFAAYTFARYDFPGREILFLGILGLLMIPGILTLVPAFLLIRDFGLIGTRWALILPYAAMGLPLAVFLLKAFLDAIPHELFEAASIDGCGDARMFTTVVVPLLRPAIATVATFSAITAWNEFLLALLYVTSDELKTLPTGLLAFSDRYTTNYQLLFAALTIVTAPIVAVYVAFHRQVVAGLTDGATR